MGWRLAGYQDESGNFKDPRNNRYVWVYWDSLLPNYWEELKEVHIEP